MKCKLCGKEIKKSKTGHCRTCLEFLRRKYKKQLGKRLRFKNGKHK